MVTLEPGPVLRPRRVHSEWVEVGQQVDHLAHLVLGAPEAPEAQVAQLAQALQVIQVAPETKYGRLVSTRKMTTIE